MRQVVLYIKDKDNKYQLAEMFSDETISITSKIQDVKEPDKIFTDFTKAFTMPASKENNKILQHWYNSSIQDGFDYRIKKDAILEVDYTPFKRGKIQLKKVILKNGLPFSYSIVFYGNTVNLKDVMKDDELQQLDYLDNYNHDYNAGNVYLGLQTGLTKNSVNNSVIYPLITHTKRLYYDSSTHIKSGTTSGEDSSKLITSSGGFTPAVSRGDYVVNTTNNTAATVTLVESGNQLALSEDIFVFGQTYKIYKKIQYNGNLHYDNTQSERGLSYVDVKPAILCSQIITAIEQKYNIDFIGNFFTSDSFSNLYMWMHRNKGGLTTEGTQTKIIGDLNYSSGASGTTSTSFDVSDTNWEFNVTGEGREKFDFTLALDIKTGYTDVKYSVKAYDSISDTVVAELKDIKGDNTLSWGIEFLEDIPVTYYNISWTVEAESTVFFTPTLTLDYEEIDDNQTNTLQAVYVTSPAEINTLSQIIVKDHLPKLKTIDFLTGIFKMFNLTAYYEDNYASSNFGKIVVETLDDFYTNAKNNISGGSYNISKYVDVEKSTVEAPIVYKTIDFKYKEPKTLLSKQHEEEFNDVFGNERFTLSGLDFGKTYKIEIPFEHMKYERLFDDNNGDITEILWGYAADGKFDSDLDNYPAVGDYDPVLTNPLLFYGIREDISSQYINWIDVDNIPNNPPNNITRYWRPSNTNSSGESKVLYNYNSNYSANLDIYPEYTLNFDNEVDEWTLTDYNGNTNSLFRNFYGNYIRDLFDKRKRILKIDSHLSQEILINHKLNDRLSINNQEYTINKIDTNFMTEKSNIELLNVLPPTYYEIQLYYAFSGNTCNNGTLVTVYSDVATITFGSETSGKIYANKSLTVFAPNGKYGNSNNYDNWYADGMTMTTPSYRKQGFWQSEFDVTVSYPLTCSGGG